MRYLIILLFLTPNAYATVVGLSCEFKNGYSQQFSNSRILDDKISIKNSKNIFLKLDLNKKKVLENTSVKNYFNYKIQFSINTDEIIIAYYNKIDWSNSKGNKLIRADYTYTIDRILGNLEEVSIDRGFSAIDKKYFNCKKKNKLL